MPYFTIRPMASISLCMIVKNEEKVLYDGLSSVVEIADEIIIIDTGSTDKTKEIAQLFTDKVYDFTWVDDFSAARTFADSFATKEYILRWDADWVLRSGLDTLLQAKEKHFNTASIVDVTWNLEFDAEMNPTRFQDIYLLYRRGEFVWKSPIHNRIEYKKKSKTPTRLRLPDVAIDHLKDPNEKVHRYSQTISILETHRKKGTKEYPRYTLFLAQAYDHKGDDTTAFTLYKEALDIHSEEDTKAFVLEKMLDILAKNKDVDTIVSIKNDFASFTHPRYLLAIGQALSTQDQKTSIEYLESYLTNPYTPEYDGWDYVPYTFEILPHILLIQLYFATRDKENMQTHINTVLESDRISKIEEYKLRFLQLIKPLMR